MGASIQRPNTDQMLTLLQSLKAVDKEHTDVSLTHEMGWCISVHSSGSSNVAIFEHVELDIAPAHMSNLTVDQAHQLWTLLALGDIGALRELDWKLGYA
jgi:ribosomal silencing factor RsfS